MLPPSHWPSLWNDNGHRLAPLCFGHPLRSAVNNFGTGIRATLVPRLVWAAIGCVSNSNGFEEQGFTLLPLLSVCRKLSRSSQENLVASNSASNFETEQKLAGRRIGQTQPLSTGGISRLGGRGGFSFWPRQDPRRNEPR